eukprot:4390269-Pyramimonas_sp.AAC.1
MNKHHTGSEKRRTWNALVAAGPGATRRGRTGGTSAQRAQRCARDRRPLTVKTRTVPPLLLVSRHWAAQPMQDGGSKHHSWSVCFITLYYTAATSCI